MNITIDISYYPLGCDHIPPILDFIHRMNQYPDFVVKTNGLSTQIFGEFDTVMNAVKSEIRKSFELPLSVFVLKIINNDQRNYSN
ncbi:MAG: hypothetical protein U1C46_04480 [Bacteroidales bacterium]|nr:hypothetical protein [Bacteroidales bacterium]